MVWLKFIAIPFALVLYFISLLVHKVFFTLAQFCTWVSVKVALWHNSNTNFIVRCLKRCE